MPGEIVGEVFSGSFRFVFRILIEVIFEFLIKGLGYLICRIFSKRVDSEGLIVVVVGLVVWGLIIWGGFQLVFLIEVDSCLDSGGSYNYQISECEYSEK